MKSTRYKKRRMRTLTLTMGNLGAKEGNKNRGSMMLTINRNVLTQLSSRALMASLGSSNSESSEM